MITYTRILTDEEQQILEHDLLDVIKWIDDAITGKINNCMKRAAIQYKDEAIKLGLKTVPVDHQECALSLFELESYQNRAERETINESTMGGIRSTETRSI